MKDLKALELLRFMLDVNEENHLYNTSIDERVAYISEAIAELEALENRSCINCLYFYNQGHNFGLCNKGVSSDFKIGTFYCGKYKAKK